MTMDRTQIRKELEEIGKQVTAWSWALGPLSDKETSELLPRTIDRVVNRLQELGETVKGNEVAL